MNTIKKLRRYYLYIILCLVIFFNIERLDFGQENTINIQTEIYMLGTAAVLLTLLVPTLYRAPLPALLGSWTVIYLSVKIFQTDHPLFGGSFTYLTITELVFVLLMVFLTRLLARIVEDHISATRILSLAGIDSTIPELKDVDTQIQSEINRSRHFGRSMSVVLVRADLKSTQIVLPSLLAEIQASFIQRYLNAKVANVLKTELRRMDILAMDHKAGRLIIINPETSAQDSPEMLQRMKAAVERELGISIDLSAATFPDQAYSFDDLVKTAEKDLNKATTHKSPASSLVVEPLKVDEGKAEI